MNWFRKVKEEDLEEMRRGWWENLLLVNEEIRELQYQLNRYSFNTLISDALRAQIWRLRHKLYPLAEKLGLSDVGAELPFKRTIGGSLPPIPEWLLHREAT